MALSLRYAQGLQGLPAQGLVELFEQLDGLRRRSPELDASAVPLITLHLRSGLEISGWLLEWNRGEKSRGPVLALHRASPDASRPDADVFFTGLEEVAAVTVHDAPAAARHLRPPVTPMGLERLAMALGDSLSKKAGYALRCKLEKDTFSEQALAVGAEILEELRGALESIAGDDAGRTTLREKVKSLRIESGKILDLKLKGTELVATFPAKAGNGADASSLQRALEELL